jgi:drug/metabolite transporter (DMT)-like permease
MPCLLLLIGIAFPRLALVLLFLFTTFLQRAYHSLLLVVLGFVFLPLTTIVYAWVVNGRHPLDGLYLAAIILAVLADLGFLGHGEYQRRRS